VRDCPHGLVHESEVAATVFAAAHMAEMVDRQGFAVCTCHAHLRPDLTPFDCQTTRATHPAAHTLHETEESK
jgi:hypothetical protein